MIILLFIISITMLIISIIFNKKGNEARKDTAGWFTSLILFGFTTITCLFATLGFTASVVKSKYIVEKITMYEQQIKSMPINQVVTINYVALRPDTWQPRFKITTIGGTVNIVWENFAKYFKLVK